MESLFKNVRIVIAGFIFSESIDLKKKFQKAGGTVEYSLSDRTSYLVVTEKEFNQKTSKISCALNKRVPIVNLLFLEKCYELNKIVDHSHYLFTTPEREQITSTSTTKIFEEKGKRLLLQDINDTENKRRKTQPENTILQTDAPEPALPQDEISEAPVEDTKKKTKHRKTHTQAGGKWRTARVFISSTFRDMHGERDYLTRYVFPELQEKCHKLRVHVHPVDLRWGVTSEDTENALEICLTELDSCRPFFIGLLGSRYGWAPSKYVVPNEPRFDFLKRTPPGRSITHIEMEYGVLQNPTASRAAFYLRDPNFLQNVPSEYKQDFYEESVANGIVLGELKEKIKQVLPPEFVFQDYPCSWKGVVDGKPMVDGLEKFGQHVLEALWKHFQEEFPLQETNLDPLAIERSYHEHFIESHSRLFVGRQVLLNKIRQFTEQTTPYPLVIEGQPGSGKTSLVSYFAHVFSREMKNSEKTLVLIHFVGAAPGSTSVRPMLNRLVQEIGNFFGFKVEKIPEDFKELQSLFFEHLKKIGTLPNHKLVLILDALNQLDSTNHSHSLDWLPEELPPNVRLIVSTLPGDVLKVLSNRTTEHLSVGGLSREEQEEIVRQTLWQFGKRLEPGQVAALLKKTDAGKPLYLIVACEELRVFGVFEKVGERIKAMADTVPKLFEEVLHRLETDHDRDLVIKTLAILTCSRGGLLETEILQLLGSRKDHYPLPQSTWSRLYRSLQNYLRPPGESGEGVLDFFHQQLPKAVKRLYLSNKNFEQQIHKELADFFWEQADPNMDGMWDAGNKRGLEFVVYHQIKANLWSQLKDSLCNLAFIEAKSEIGMTYDLVADYLQLNESKDDIPVAIAEEISEYQRFVLGRAHVLVHSPSLTFSMAYSLPNNSLPAKQAHYRYYVACLESRPFLNWKNKPQTSNPCIMTLSGHDMVIRCCAISPDPLKKRIVSASDDHLLKIYDAMTGEVISTLKGHSNSVLSCVYSPNGQFIVSGGYDRVLFIWDANTGLIERQLSGFKGVITGCAVAPNNKTIAGTSRDRTIRIYEETDLVVTLEGHEKGVMSAEFSSNGEWLATCSEDTTIRIWDTHRWSTVRTLSGHEKPVNSISWSPDNGRLVSASDDRKVILWDAESGQILHRLAGHNDGATCAVFSKSGLRLLSASHDNLIQLWDPTSGSLLSTLVGHTGSVFRAVFSPSDDRIVTCSFDRSVKVWEVRDHVEKVGHEARILCVTFSPNGKKIVTGARDKTLKVWDTLTGKELHHLRGHTSNVFGACWSPDGRLVCSAGRDKVLKIWDAHTGECRKTLEGHAGPVRYCAWAPGGEHVLSASEDKTLGIWEVEGGFRRRGTLFGHHAEVVFCTYSKDGRKVASCSEDKTIKLWNTNKDSFKGSYVKVATLCFHELGVKSLGFSPDCSRLVSGGDDMVLVEWNTQNAKILSKLYGHTEDIRGCGYTADGKWIISGSTDSTVRLWNAVTKQVDCSFACEGRLCALDSSMVSFHHVFACGDGSGTLYILVPEGLESDEKRIIN